MKICNLFSKRQKALRGEVPDVYQYDTIPSALRVQILQILDDAVGPSTNALRIYTSIQSILCREYGTFFLVSKNYTADEDMRVFLLECTKTDLVLDAVELGLRFVDRHVRERPWEFDSKKISPDDAIGEANHRFKEHGVGYEYLSGEMIRIDSQIMHSEVVKPALVLLHDQAYAGAEHEFLQAHEHYRHQRHKESIICCAKAFESVMKSICSKRGWHVSSDAAAKKLIETCKSGGLFASFQQNYLNNLTAMLESGVPTIRNKTSAHGQGSEAIHVPEAMARFTLHQTASILLFLVESERDLAK